MVRVTGPKWEMKMGSGEDSTMRILIICTVRLSSRITKSRRSRWVGHVARMEEGTSAFKILTGKPTGKKILRSPRRT